MSPTSVRLATTSFNRFLIIIIIFNTPEAVIIIRTRASGAYATSQRLAITTTSSRTAPSSSPSFLTRASGPYFSRRRLAKPSINLNSSDDTHLHTGPCKFLILSYDFCLYLLVGRETASDSPHQLQTQSRSVNPTQISTHSTQ